MDKARDRTYLSEMKSRADGEGVRSLLIMCDREGDLGDGDDAGRSRAVENHRKWVEAAAALGCHSIRVNARSDAALDFDEQQKLAADGLRRLCELADPHGVNVIVENEPRRDLVERRLARGCHEARGSPACRHPSGLRKLPHPVGSRRVVRPLLQGVEELMLYAKAVSAKSHDFDASGNEIRTDYERMVRIVLDAGYSGYIGIEYEGNEASERDGVGLTKALLTRVRETLSQEMA